jgi:hypothetical protein
MDLVAEPMFDVSRGHDHQPLWILVRQGQRLQEKIVDYAENRRVRANAERQSQHGHRREAGVFR